MNFDKFEPHGVLDPARGKPGSEATRRAVAKSGSSTVPRYRTSPRSPGRTIVQEVLRGRGPLASLRRACPLPCCQHPTGQFV